MTAQVQKLCAYKQGYAGAHPPQQTIAAETNEREYCYRLHSEWPLLDALHAQLDHLSIHERRKRLRLLQVCGPQNSSFSHGSQKILDMHRLRDMFAGSCSARRPFYMLLRSKSSQRLVHVRALWQCPEHRKQVVAGWMRLEPLHMLAHAGADNSDKRSIWRCAVGFETYSIVQSSCHVQEPSLACRGTRSYWRSR